VAYTLLGRTKRFLKEHDLKARKGLAQHFLVDGSILKKMVSAAELGPSDTVVEVGPGPGVLTQELSKNAGKVVAVELDGRLAQILKGELSEVGNVSIVNDDILNLEPSSLITGKDYKVVANLPYYITSAVIRHFLEASVKPTLMVLMIQREVAKVITAKPGEMSLLSVSVQLYGEPKIVAKVPARSFYPAPDVDSSILKIKVLPKPSVKGQDISGFFKVVRAGFSANRKQIVNPLTRALGLNKTDTLSMLEKAGIESKRRAETLTIEEWQRLFLTVKDSGKLVVNN